MAHKTLKKKKEQNNTSLFFTEVIDAISTPVAEEEFDSDIWKYIPVSIKTFCDDMVREPLFPKQLEFAEKLLGKRGDVFDITYDEGHSFWGKGSGKDRTIAKMHVYFTYKLMCLKNPQKYLREELDCSIGDDDNIDTANMSVNSRQAENVYFKKFKSIVRRTLNPYTGNNWFEENGVDLREGYDLQTIEATFPHNITAHSLNSLTNIGEGLSPIFVFIDEFGQFRADNAFGLLDSVRDSVLSRFGSVGKVGVASFLYYLNDPMYIVFKKHLKDESVYSSKAATWEVNEMKKKSNFAKRYATNPERAKMTYECEASEDEGGFVTLKYMLNYMFDNSYANPIKGDYITIESEFLGNLDFHDFFKGKPGVLYSVHVDLATGKEKKDCVGLAMTHVDKMYPKIDPKLRKDLIKKGIYLEINDTDLEYTTKGVVVDLALQIKAASGSEVKFSDVRNFIKMLKNKYGFNIVFVSYDGWESKDSIQQLNESGINAFELSVDKSEDAYVSWKELMYQQLFKCYPHKVAKREANELMIDDKGKIDHPAKSYEREIEEGDDNGSKDVMDAIVGSGKTSYENFNLEPDVFV